MFIAWGVGIHGGVTTHNLMVSCAIRPTFYLLSTVKIKNGTGNIDDPYILDIN